MVRFHFDFVSPYAYIAWTQIHRVVEARGQGVEPAPVLFAGLLMLAPPPHPVKVFGKTKDAVAWLAPYVRSLCGPTATDDALVAAVDDLCTTFKARLRETASESSPSSA